MDGQWIHQAAKPNQEAITKALLGARDAMLRIRYHMHQMGEAAGVPVCAFFNWSLLWCLRWRIILDKICYFLQIHFLSRKQMFLTWYI